MNGLSDRRMSKDNRVRRHRLNLRDRERDNRDGSDIYQ